MKQKSNSLTKADRVGKTTKARGPLERDAREVMAELVVKLSQKPCVTTNFQCGTIGRGRDY